MPSEIGVEIFNPMEPLSINSKLPFANAVKLKIKNIENTKKSFLKSLLKVFIKTSSYKLIHSRLISPCLIYEIL